MLRRLALIGLCVAATPCIPVGLITDNGGSLMPRKTASLCAAAALANNQSGAPLPRASLSAMLKAATDRGSVGVGTPSGYMRPGPKLTVAQAVDTACVAEPDLVFRDLFEDASSCVDNYDCSSPIPVCNSGSGMCVECLANADCSDSRPRCDIYNTCSPCTSDTDCVDRSCTPHCDPQGSGSCVP